MLLTTCDYTQLGTYILIYLTNATFIVRVAIQDVGLRGNVRISLGIIGGGVNIRDLDLNFYLGGLDVSTLLSSLVMLQ